MISFAWQDAALMKFLGVEIHNIEFGLFRDDAIPEGAIVLDEGHYAIKKKTTRTEANASSAAALSARTLANITPALASASIAMQTTQKRPP